MPKNQTINKNQTTNTSNAFQFQFDGRYFLAGCIWIAAGISAFATDNQLPLIVLVVSACVYTNKLFHTVES